MSSIQSRATRSVARDSARQQPPSSYAPRDRCLLEGWPAGMRDIPATAAPRAASTPIGACSARPMSSPATSPMSRTRSTALSAPPLLTLPTHRRAWEPRLARRRPPRPSSTFRGRSGPCRQARKPAPCCSRARCSLPSASAPPCGRASTSRASTTATRTSRASTATQASPPPPPGRAARTPPRHRPACSRAMISLPADGEPQRPPLSRLRAERGLHRRASFMAR